MAITSDDLNAFHRFALARLASVGVESFQELVDVWEREHPSEELHNQNVGAIRAAIRDMESGDAGRPAGLVLAEMRAELAADRGQ